MGGSGCGEMTVDGKAPINATQVPARVSSGNLNGVLELRKSNPSVCERIYWARFTPDPTSTEGFRIKTVVTNSATGSRDSAVQPSEPSNPTVVAYTVGMHGEVGDVIQACIAPAESLELICPLSTTVVP